MFMDFQHLIALSSYMGCCLQIGIIPNQNFHFGCRKVTEAAEKQLRRLWHTTAIYVYPQMQEYAEKLASLFPDPLKVLLKENVLPTANQNVHTYNLNTVHVAFCGVA